MIQVIPVNSQKTDLQLKDYIPYQFGTEEIVTDNSSVQDDDFSIANSIIETNLKINEKLDDNIEDLEMNYESSQDEIPKFSPLDIEKVISKMKKHAEQIEFTSEEIPNIQTIG